MTLQLVRDSGYKTDTTPMCPFHIITGEAVTGAIGAVTMAAGPLVSSTDNRTDLKAKNYNSLSVNVSLKICDYLKGKMDFIV